MMYKMILFTLLQLNTPINKTTLDAKLIRLSVVSKCSFTQTSRDRTWDHNKKVNGSPKSYHLIPNQAVDVIPRCGLSLLEFAKIARQIFPGVIVYPTHIHLDLREVPYYKNYLKNQQN